MMDKRFLARSVLCAAFILSIALATRATTIVPMSVEKLAAESSDIVRVRVVSSQSAWNAQHTAIYTYSKVQVLDRMKGSKLNELTVRQPGGTVGNMTEKVFGVRHLREGQEAVLFLTPSSDGGTLSITGLVQGNFSVRYVDSGEPVVSNGVPETKSFDMKTGQVTNYNGASLRISDLRQRVARATLGGTR